MEQARWESLELAYDTGDRTRVRLDGVELDGARDASVVVADLGRDGWEMVGSAPGVGSQHVLWFQRRAAPPAPQVTSEPQPPAAEPADVAFHHVTLVSAGNSWFDPTARARLISALQDLTGQSGWRVGRMVDKAPRVVAEGVTQEEADRIRQTLEDLGATVEIG